TYKLALLLALMDGCAAGADDEGNAPTQLHTRTVAEHVLRIYLPQVRRYLATEGDPLELRQIAGGRSAVLGAVVRLHLSAEARGVRGSRAIAAELPDEHARCLDEV